MSLHDVTLHLVTVASSGPLLHCPFFGGHEDGDLLICSSKEDLCIVLQGPHGILSNLLSIDPVIKLCNE